MELEKSSSINRIIPIYEKLQGDALNQAALEIKRHAFSTSLYALAKFLLGYKDITDETHLKMIHCLESQSRRKLIVMPRGTFKTSISSVAYPIWLLLKNPNLRILLDSELYTNSKNMLREIMLHLASEEFVALFGSWPGPVWNEGEMIISGRTRVLKEASITCSGIGAQKTGQHYDVIIADDMNSPKNSHTPELCEKVRAHYRYYTSLLEPNGTIAIIGTRYSSGDLIGTILLNELGIDEHQIQSRLA